MASSAPPPGCAPVFDLSLLLGDLDGDGRIGSLDLFTLLASWGPSDPTVPAPADLDRDDAVDAVDMAVRLANCD